MTSRGGLTSSVPPARGSRTGRLRPSPENGPRVSRSGAHSAHLSLSPQRTARRRAALCGGGGVRKEGRGIPSSRGCDRRRGNGFDGKEVPFGSGVRKRCLPNTAPTEGGSQSSPSLCPHSPPFEDSEMDKGGTVTPTRCPRVPSHPPPPNPRGEQCGLCGCRAGRRDPSLGWKGAGRGVGRGVPGCRLTLSILVPRGMGRTEPNPQAALRPLLPPSRSFRLFPRSRRRRPQHGHPGPAAPRSAPAPPAAAERVPRGARPAPPHPTAAQRRSRSETAGDAAPHRGAARRIRL